MEHKNLSMNAIALQSRSAVATAQCHMQTQVAALEATIAFCQTRRHGYEQKARAIEALCAELQSRKTRPN